MKRFETPILNVEKFDLVNIVTTSGEAPAPKAVEAAAVAIEAAGIAAENTFTITL